MQYVALLRGINVGGNNKVDMQRLTQLCTQLGWHNVQTYINSGNVIFEASEKPEQELSNALADAMQNEFGFSVPIIVLTSTAFQYIADSLPDTWKNDAETKCDVMFLWNEVNTPDVTEKIRTKPEIDDVRYVNGALLWCVPKKHVTKSGIAKLIGTNLYAHMTIRNCNTVRKLASLISATTV